MRAGVTLQRGQHLHRALLPGARRELLKGSTVRATSTIGFPHGGHTTAIKLAEVAQALKDGGEELDAVVNISKVRSRDWQYVSDELNALADATHTGGAKIKVIFENAYLDDAAKIRLCEICAEVGADWVKTSTGYAPSGATLPDLELMRRYSPPQVQVKAAGGVHDLDTVLAMRAIGVSRVGTREHRSHSGGVPQTAGAGSDCAVRRRTAVAGRY